MDPCTGDFRVFPFEIFVHILDHLPPADRISTRLANKYLWNMEKKDGDWDENFSRHRLPGPVWWPPFVQWRRPCQEKGLFELLNRLARDAPGLVHVCPNCKVLHHGPCAKSSLYDVGYSSTQGFADLLGGRGFCAASGSSDWEVRDLFLDGSRRRIPVAEKREFHATRKGAGRFAYHRVVRVLLPASVALALPAMGQQVVLALWTCPFIICRHFALRFLNTTDVVMTGMDRRKETVWGDTRIPSSQLDTGRGWVLPFDAQNIGVVPSGRVERGGWFECCGCSTAYGFTTHFHGERGVEVVLDVFHRRNCHSDWQNSWEPKRVPDAAFFNTMTPERMHRCYLDPKLRGWVFPTPLLVPGESGISDHSFGAAERELKRKYFF